MAVAAPSAGDTKVGDVFKTLLPVPVLVVVPVPPLPTGNAVPKLAEGALRAPRIVKSPVVDNVIGVPVNVLPELYANQLNPPLPEPF